MTVRFIEYMPFDGQRHWGMDKVVSGNEILERIREHYELDLVPLIRRGLLALRRGELRALHRQPRAQYLASKLATGRAASSDSRSRSGPLPDGRCRPLPMTGPQSTRWLAPPTSTMRSRPSIVGSHVLRSTPRSEHLQDQAAAKRRCSRGSPLGPCPARQPTLLLIRHHVRTAVDSRAARPVVLLCSTSSAGGALPLEADASGLGTDLSPVATLGGRVAGR